MASAYSAIELPIMMIQLINVVHNLRPFLTGNNVAACDARHSDVRSSEMAERKPLRTNINQVSFEFSMHAFSVSKGRVGS